MQRAVGVSKVDMLHACVLIAACPGKIACHPIEDARICIGSMRYQAVDASLDHCVVHRVLDPRWPAALFAAMAKLIERRMEPIIQWKIGVDDVAMQKDGILETQQMRVDLKAPFSLCKA